ncbi:MAG TPA: hypothetical protein VGA48_05230 [Thermoplasmata archaeon]
MLGRTDLEPYTTWDFPSQSDGHPGAGDASFNGVTPALCAVNLVRRYTRPGDLVADPMAGCYDEATDVLTRDGWKPWRDATTEDEFATLIDGRLEYRQAVNMIKAWHDGPMYRVRTKHVDLLVTPEHSLYVAERHSPDGRYNPYHLACAKDVFGRNVRYRKDAVWEGVEQAFFELPEIRTHRQPQRGASVEQVFSATRFPMDAWLRFLGHFLTDGSCTVDGGSHRIKLSQVKPESRPAFRASLAEIARHLRRPLHGDSPNIIDSEDGFAITHSQLGAYVSALGKKTERKLPREFLTLASRQLGILYDALIDGDGHRRCPDGRGGTDVFYTSSPYLRDGFQEICLKLGWAASIWESTRPGDCAGPINGRLIRAKNVNWGLSVNRRQLRPRVYITRNRYDRPDTRNVEFWDHYRGHVYCANVPPSHILYVRRNGKAVWCGNSGTIGDVARALGRRALSFDLAPRRSPVLRADARAWPLRDESAALVVVDSPYSDNIVYCRDPRCLGRISCRDPRFIVEMSRVAREASRVLRRGGVLAWIIADEYRAGVYTPVGFRLLAALEREFEVLDTIALVRRHDRSASPMWEHRARRFNFFLRGFKFLFILRKRAGEPGG